MPLLTVSGADALENLNGNPNAIWPQREPADNNRIEPLCKPAFSPSFRLEREDKIFTIGSCFARNIEYALAARGYDVATASLKWPDPSVDTIGRGVLNNYGVVSIENEFRWALDPDRPFDPDIHFLEVIPSKFLDPHLPVRPAGREKMLSYRRAVGEATRLVTECRVVIMTLGLSELWFDKRAQTYLNRSPPRGVVLREPERFEIRLLDFDETRASLETVIALLRRYCRPDQRILLTVSPVPLRVTHTKEDVLVLNSYSKSVLRAVAGHVAAAHDHVDYFPSYESVTLSERSRAWLDDQTHVRPELIQLNVERMLEAYASGQEAAPTDFRQILRYAEIQFAAGNRDEALRVLDPLRQAETIDAKFVLPYARLCVALGRHQDARGALTKTTGELASWRAELIEANIEIAEGRADEGLARLNNLAGASREKAVVLRALADACMQLKKWDEALQAAMQWGAMAPNIAEPLRMAARIHRARGDAVAAERALQNIRALANARDIDHIDYAEFLIEQKRFEEAARVLADTRAETFIMQRRIERLRSFLPALGNSDTVGS